MKTNNSQFVEPTVYLLAELAKLLAAHLGTEDARAVASRAAKLAVHMREYRLMLDAFSENERMRKFE